MTRRVPLLAAFCSTLCAASPAAFADTVSDTGLDKAKRVGEKLIVGKWVPAKGLMYAVGAGWESVDLIGVSGELGYAWGRQRTGLSNMASMHHVSLAPRLMTPAGETDVSIDVAAMIGHSWRALAHFSASAGASVRLTPEVEYGPLVRLRAGYQGVGIYFYSGVRVGDDTDFVAGLGVELFKLPSMTAVQSLMKTVPSLTSGR